MCKSCSVDPVGEYLGVEYRNLLFPGTTNCRQVAVFVEKALCGVLVADMLEQGLQASVRVDVRG